MPTLSKRSFIVPFTIALLAMSTIGCKEVDREIPKAVLDVALPEAFKINPDPARKIGVVVVMHLKGEGGGDWTIDMKKPEVRKGVANKPDLRVTMAAEDFAKLMSARLDLRKAMKEDKVVVEGNLELLESVFNLISGSKK